jgi:GcrA cell cycle regulator
MEWTDESISLLRTLWQEGLSTAEIGRRMSITKNAVVGKAHRLTLPPRPSPIRKMAVAGNTALSPAAATAEMVRPDTVSEVVADHAAAAVAPVPAVAAAPAPASVVPPTVAEPSVVQPIRPVVAQPEPTAMPQPVAVERVVVRSEPPLRAVQAEPRRRGLTCCWPLGEPGTKEFRFCGDEPVAGKPYCQQHAALAYVKIRDRRDNVA